MWVRQRPVCQCANACCARTVAGATATTALKLHPQTACHMRARVVALANDVRAPPDCATAHCRRRRYYVRKTGRRGHYYYYLNGGHVRSSFTRALLLLPSGFFFYFSRPTNRNDAAWPAESGRRLFSFSTPIRPLNRWPRGGGRRLLSFVPGA